MTELKDFKLSHNEKAKQLLCNCNCNNCIYYTAAFKPACVSCLRLELEDYSTKEKMDFFDKEIVCKYWHTDNILSETILEINILLGMNIPVTKESVSKMIDILEK